MKDPSRSLAWWLSRAGLALLGDVCGAITCTLAFFASFGTTWTVVVEMAALFTLVPAALILWFARSGGARVVGVGMTATFVTLFVVVVVWHPWNTMSGEEID